METKKQKALAKKHGHPVQFASAVSAACCSMEITSAEAKAAIDEYDKEWEEAGKDLKSNAASRRVKSQTRSRESKQH